MIFLFLISLVSALAEKENGVLVFTDQNFDTEIANYEHLLVEFYAPWCAHCKALAPEYEKAAKSLDLAKVDATKNEALAKRFEVKGFPTLLFFINGEPIKYEGPRKAQGIINWVNKKSLPPSTEMECGEIEQYAEDNEYVLAYFGSEDHDQYTQAHVPYAKTHDDIVFIHNTNEQCGKKFGI